MNKFAIAAVAATALTSSAFAQQEPAATTGTAPAAESAAPATTASTLKLTDAEAKAWINKVIYSSDGKNVGEAAAFARDASGNVTEMHADVGGFLGLGETRVRVMPSQFKLASDRIILNVASTEVKSLPHLPK